MELPVPRNMWLRPFLPSPQAGTILLEVLVAIFVMGVGLLALLTLFPLGALEMARAIEDDRTAAVAADAVALSEAGERLILETSRFVETSLANGSVDPETAARLQEDYECLALQADALEVKALELQSVFPPDLIQPHLSLVLADIRSIKHRIIPIVRILSLFHTGPA